MKRYIPVTEDEAEEEKKHPGNIGLPFGLCEKYGISLPENATPRDAWNALENKIGITPKDIYKELKQKEKNDIIEENSESDFIQTIKSRSIVYNEVKPIQKKLSNEDIILKVGGGDLTKGSCSSVAFAYIGNTLGFDVSDFRGGESCDFFGRIKNVKEIASLKGVKGKIVEVEKELLGAVQLLKNNLEIGQEYYFAAGKHAAIVRKTNLGYQYLELQEGNPSENGWKTLNTNALIKRFSCRKTPRTLFGEKLKSSLILFNTASLKENLEFKKILGYINTTVETQEKGENGYAK